MDEWNIRRLPERKKANSDSVSAVNEVRLEDFYRRMLTEVSLNRFKWSGLPEEIDERFLETALYYNGLVVFFEEHAAYNKHMIMRAAPNGNPNMYENPTSFQAYATGMTSRNLKYSEIDELTECVPIWANYTRRPNAEIVDIYATRLAKVDRSIDIAIVNARTPLVFAGESDLRLSAVNAYGQIASGAEFVQLSQSLSDSITGFPINIDPKTFEYLHSLRARLYNECMGFLGIDNANQEKKERLIEGEVEANEEQTDVARAINMNAREQACDRINKIYGLDVSVEYVNKNESLALQQTLDMQPEAEETAL